MLWTNIFVTCIGINSFAIQFTNYADSRSTTIMVFFAFAGLVLFLVPTKSNRASTKSNHILTFLAHFSLYSDSLPWNNLLVLLALHFLFWTRKRKSNWFKKIPKSIFILLDPKCTIIDKIHRPTAVYFKFLAKAEWYQ